MTSPASVDAQLLEDLVDANHILFNEGVVDAFGHVSIRHDKRPDRFLLARNIAPALVRADDIQEFDLDGNLTTDDSRRVYLERFIHGEIYRARPDVAAVVHSHSPSVVPFSAVKNAKFRPISHMCGFLGDGAARFEIREFAGDATDLLVRNAALGVALAKTLADCNVVLMRGHGSTVVGPTLKHAVYRAIYTEVNARLLTEALRLGDVEYLSSGEALATTTTNEGQLERPWALWKQAANRSSFR
ncbi:MAG TPA: class II aldolase/adducin family protein [Casimicrobiaceae bacterium]|jgi:HCOMODA/2-hydroxy-3-carboxy-muconic semialdehyde decarboxylase